MINYYNYPSCIPLPLNVHYCKNVKKILKMSIGGKLYIYESKKERKLESAGLKSVAHFDQWHFVLTRSKLYKRKMLAGRKCGQSAETEALAGKSIGIEEERESPPDLAKAPSGECPPSTAPCQYAYLDHTADVQLHAWGQSLGEALEQLTISLYGYMTTEIERVEPIYTMDFSASGHDLSALVYNMLDNCLYSFSAEPFFIGRVAKVLKLKKPAGNTGEELSAHMRIWGESFDLQKHPPGTEIKAITYSNMQIIRKDGVEEGGRKKATGEEAVGWHGRTDIFVIVDI